MDKRRTENVRVFQDTIARLKSDAVYRELTQNAIKNTELFTPSALTAARFSDDVKITVTKERTIECAVRMVNETGKRTAALNFASPKHAGGGVVTGATAQEEAVCRVTNLYPCLNRMANNRIFYDTRVKSPYTDQVLYTRDVAVIKTDTDNPQPLGEGRYTLVDIVTCAAPNQSGIRIPDEELSQIIRRRTNIILNACATNGADIVVLGAWGCGAFRNPPTVVAKAIFDEIRENYLRRFEQIVFAVYYRGGEIANYNAFNNELAR
jgi:uncharacterized protein (TIGR02452 family)